MAAVLDTPPLAPQAPAADTGAPIVRITALRKSYGANEVLKGIDLDVKRGEVIAIIGKSGSGKSTLLRCINGLEVFQEGSLTVDGKQLLASMESMSKAPWLTRFFHAASGGLMKLKVATKREGSVLLTRMTIDTKALPATTRSELKGLPFFDGKPIEGRSTVVGDRLIMVVGPAGKTRIQALAGAPAAPAAAGALAAALGDTKGADGFYYIDVAGALRPALAIAAQGPIGTLLERYRRELPTLFIVSDVLLDVGSAEGQDQVHVEVEKAPGMKCERCWRIVPVIVSQPEYAGLCERCVDALAGGAHPR